MTRDQANKYCKPKMKVVSTMNYLFH